MKICARALVFTSALREFQDRFTWIHLAASNDAICQTKHFTISDDKYLPRVSQLYYRCWECQYPTCLSEVRSRKERKKWWNLFFHFSPEIDRFRAELLLITQSQSLTFVLHYDGTTETLILWVKFKRNYRESRTLRCDLSSAPRQLNERWTF